jgi:hypothetical protein
MTKEWFYEDRLCRTKKKILEQSVMVTTVTIFKDEKMALGDGMHGNKYETFSIDWKDAFVVFLKWTLIVWTNRIRLANWWYMAEVYLEFHRYKNSFLSVCLLDRSLCHWWDILNPLNEITKCRRYDVLTRISLMKSSPSNFMNLSLLFILLILFVSLIWSFFHI